MPALTQRRCRNHAGREAVAKCMTCHEVYCRECVVEHEGRMTCKHCLDAILGTEAKKRFQLMRPLFHGLASVASFLFCFLIFYLLGRYLLTISQTFYDLGR